MAGFGISARYGRAVHLAVVPLVVFFICAGFAPEHGPPYVIALGLALVVFLSSYLLCRQLDASCVEKCSLDEQLIQTQKLAALGEISSGIAHEINTPLAIISQESEWLRHLLKSLHPAGQDSPPDALADCNESLDQIIVQVNRCKEITHGMLNFARKREAVEQDTDVNRLVEDMTTWIEQEGSRNNIIIRRDYDQHLPLIATDSPLLRQVTLNLLNNAFQAVERDGEITISTRRVDRSHIAIEIRDTGCGIPKEHLDKIFNPFFTTKDPGKGTGLGLSISLSIVHRLGGTIAAASEPGKFTALTVTLPIKHAPDAGAPAQPLTH